MAPEEGNPPMTAGDQVFSGQAGTMLVVQHQLVPVCKLGQGTAQLAVEQQQG